MGTRAIVVIEDAGSVVASIYRQWDGYDLGDELYRNFGQIEIVRCNSSEFEMGKHAVGMGCFAAQVVEFLKSKVGEIYLVPFDKDDEASNDINVFIRLTEENGKVVIMEKRKGRLYYSGKLEDYPVDGVMDKESLMKIIEALPDDTLFISAGSNKLRINLFENSNGHICSFDDTLYDENGDEIDESEGYDEEE